jgi:predicted SAM-dependent methyltransferase
MEIIDRILSEHQEVKLEIGSGERIGSNGWVTLDQNDTCDIKWDLVNGIPFPDESVGIIYSSHLLEHFTFKEIQVLLAECKRVLKQGGTISVSVPCAKFFIDAYVRRDVNYWDSLPLHWDPAWDNTSSLIDLVNYIAYMDGHHKYMFDEENLIQVLKLAGFRNSRLREFDPELDSLERRHESIFAVAER